MTFRAVLFDLGGVVLTSPMEGFTTYERQAGLPAGLIRTLNATNPDTNAWARVERGEVDVPGFVAQFEAESRAAGYEVDATAVLAGLTGTVRPAMVAAIRALKAAGLRLAAGTNNVAPLASAGRADLDEVLALFDVLVESAIVGVRKPEPAFYALVLERLGLAAGEVVFLDDLGINLKPARALGMTTIKVVDPDVALAELSAHLGLPIS